MLMFHIIKTSQFKHMSGSHTIKHTSFFTVKPIDTDTNGNLQRERYNIKHSIMELPSGLNSEESFSIIGSVSSALSNYPWQRGQSKKESN